jgi:anti-sigma B factor antagonist
MRMPARKALGPVVRPFGIAALGVAFPLVTDANADRPWAPGMETLAPAIVLTVALWAMSAWIHQVYVAHRERAYLDVLLRAMRAFAAGAVVFVVLTGLTRERALSPLLSGLYFAFALVLLFGARLGRRAVVTGASRYDVVRRGAEALTSLAPRERRARRDTLPDLTPAREIEAPVRSGPRPQLREEAPAPRPKGEEGVLQPARVLDAIRSCMDEVSYTPGNPNVLSMTKYLHDGGTPRSSAAPKVGARRFDGDAGTGFGRIDEGDETVLHISGVLDAVSAQDVRPTVEALLAENIRSIRVDLSALRLIDSTGVGLIVGLFKRSRTFGGTVRVSGLKDQPLAIFRLLRLDRIFELQ